MHRFTLCPDCTAEYQDPADRRFHAQPLACPVCGPTLWLERLGDGPAPATADAAETAAQLLLNGAIIAVKGIGGFHDRARPSDAILVNGAWYDWLSAERSAAVEASV
jgi:hydrogenase maturation protein HypF